MKDKEQLTKLLEKLEEYDISASYFERVLRLSSGTISRWRTGKIAKEELALLQIIVAYPWILHVMDFESDVKAKKAFADYYFNRANPHMTLAEANHLLAAIKHNEQAKGE